MAELSMGTYYDVNKQLYAQMSALTTEEKEEKILAFPFLNFFHKHKYYMLLCKEISDYTVFNMCGNKDFQLPGKELIECLDNRGQVVSVELTESKDAYEIWLKNEEGVFCYLLFPYDFGVVEV